MKILILLPIFIFLFFSHGRAQDLPAKKLPVKEPWTQAQLMEPAALAKALQQYVIFNIGAVEDIPGARHIGPAQKTENLQKFRKAVSALPKSSGIVVYCGCCPFERCPNIRPAFAVLTENGYRNARLLNLPTNLNTDWVKKGYPLATGK